MPHPLHTIANNPARTFNYAVIIALVAMLLAGLLFPDMARFQGKAWPARAVSYPIAALIVPIWWWRSNRTDNYPHLVAALLVLPFVSDLAGNVANLFDTVQNFDDILHFMNWTFLTAALVIALSSLRLARWNRILLGTGFGAIAIIIWEIIEYLIAESGTSGLNLTYKDTISDLGLSTLGGLVGATIATYLKDPKRTP
jgi:glycopeptide antibiotics resistance protein